MKYARPITFGIVLSLVVAFGACASHQAALKTTLSVVDGAAQAFADYDKQHQAQLLTQSATFDDWKSASDGYRHKQQVVVDSFVLSYQALATAALKPSDVSFSVALADVGDLVKLLEVLGVKVPGANLLPTPAASSATEGSK